MENVEYYVEDPLLSEENFCDGEEDREENLELDLFFAVFDNNKLYLYP